MWPAAIPPKMTPDTGLTMASSEETLSALATVSTKPASISASSEVTSAKAMVVDATIPVFTVSELDKLLKQL
jgi:hypothetical protein